MTSIFTDNIGDNTGGALILEYMNMQILNTSFLNNKALEY